MSFRLLFVCTGNICRSPMAEHLARAVLAERLGEASTAVSVGSAGIWGHEGSPMEPEALQALALVGIDGTGFRARELTPEMVAAADLVLAAAGEHHTATVALDPSARDKVFGLAEFAGLLGAMAPVDLPGRVEDRGRAVVAAAAALRNADGADHHGADVPDPFGSPVRVFARTAALIQGLLGPLATALAPAAVTTPGSAPIAHVGMVRP